MAVLPTFICRNKNNLHWLSVSEHLEEKKQPPILLIYNMSICGSWPHLCILHKTTFII